MKIILLTDYKDRFTSKWSAKPYCSGMDKEIINNEFNKRGFTVEFLFLSRNRSERKRFFKRVYFIYFF